MDVAAVILWLAIVGAAIAVLATTATTPPLFDAISYATKAMNFWESLGQGKLVNPLNLVPSVRPPGTILVSYPFGYTPDFAWFYFRSAFIPIALLAGAVYIAGDRPDLTRARRWLLAALALAVAGMPGLYQFHPNEQLELRMGSQHALAIWGHVDNFFAGVAAMAMAATVRSVRKMSVAWAAGAAAFAALSLLIKPVGSMVMALVGIAWLFQALVKWPANTLRADGAARTYILKSLGAALLIYAVVVLACFHSAYFSPTNIAYGNGALAILKAEFHTPLNAELLGLMVHNELGLIVPIAIAFGIALGVQRNFGTAFVAALSIALGVWLLVVKTDPGQLRYFLPFAAMAFVASVPNLISVEGAAARIGAGLAIIPTLLITALLIARHPPQPYQDALGINLPKVDYATERAQAETFFRALQDAGVARTVVYQFDITPPLYHFAAALDYRNYMVRTQPQVQMIQPVDWERPSTFRFEQIRQADYIAFEPVEDAGERAAILSRDTVPNFRAETRLMNAWFSGLTDADGVSVVSDTHVRLLKITDHTLLEASLAKLQDSYHWPMAFNAVNLPRWWSASEIEAFRRDNPASALDVTFQAAGAPTVQVYAAKVGPEALGVQARFWVKSEGALDGWFLFAHLTNAKGEILAGTHVALMAPTTPEREIRYYTLDFPRLPEGATVAAFGFYRPEKDTAAFLSANSGNRDWNDHRVLLPLTEP
jgi:hypothetical protein